MLRWRRVLSRLTVLTRLSVVARLAVDARLSRWAWWSNLASAALLSALVGARGRSSRAIAGVRWSGRCRTGWASVGVGRSGPLLRVGLLTADLAKTLSLGGQGHAEIGRIR